MRAVGVRELRTHISEILRQIEVDGETVAVTNHGTVVAHLVPVRRAPVDVEAVRASLAELDRLAAEIGAYWPEGVSAVEAVRDVRRDL
jgi:prevent-host-death family protein